MADKLSGSVIQPGTITTVQLSSGVSNTVNNAVLKTGDTMTGQLNIAAGGLIVQSSDASRAAFFRSSTRTFTIRPYYNEEGNDRGTWIEAFNTTGGAYNKLTITSTNLILDVSSNVGIGNTNPSSKLTVAGTIESTTGGVKFPDGTTQVSAATGAPALNVVSGTSVTAIKDNHYIITNGAATTVTLPATPANGDIVWVTVASNTTNNIIARNGKLLQGLAEDMNLNDQYASAQLRFVNDTYGWRMI